MRDGLGRRDEFINYHKETCLLVEYEGVYFSKEKCLVFLYQGVHFSLKVVFGFSQYTSLAEVDSAVANVRLMNGSCNAGDALDQCGSDLFAGDAAGRKRVVIVLIAGKSPQDVSSSAAALKTDGIKIIAIGMGSSADKSQLSAMAFSPSYVLTAALFSGLPGISGSVSNIVSQGMCNGIFLHFLSFSFTGELRNQICQNGHETVSNNYNCVKIF